MQQTLILLLSLLFFIASCGDDTTDNKESNENNSTEENSSETSKTTEENKVEEPKTTTVYAWVDKLRIRESPNLKAKEVTKVAEGDAMTFSGEISSEKIKITLRGRKMEAPFYKVKTADGTEGWTFAGALSNVPVDVEGYRVAFAFDTRVFNEDEEDSGDWGYYLYEAGQMLVGSGVDLIYVEKPFNALEIENSKGEIIGVENISSYVKKHTTGIVCLEKGKEAKFVDYSPDMGSEVLKVYSRSDSK